MSWRHRRFFVCRRYTSPYVFTYIQLTCRQPRPLPAPPPTSGTSAGWGRRLAGLLSPCPSCLVAIGPGPSPRPSQRKATGTTSCVAIYGESVQEVSNRGRWALDQSFSQSISSYLRFETVERAKGLGQKKRKKRQPSPDTRLEKTSQRRQITLFQALRSSHFVCFLAACTQTQRFAGTLTTHTIEYRPSPHGAEHTYLWDRSCANVVSMTAMFVH